MAPKKTAKKTKKTSSKKSSKSSSNPLAMARDMLNSALKSTDWEANLDPNGLKESQPHLNSGSIVINHLIGGKPNQHGVAPCPGLPKGRILNLYGHESSGKTTLALEASAATCKDGGTVCYIDWENEIVPEYAAALGVPIGDPERFMLCQPDTLDDGIAILWTMANAGVDLIVLDSVGAGVPKAFFEQKISEQAEQGRIGKNASVWSQFLPKLKGRINRTGSTIIGISQIRSSISTMGYGDNITVQGGNAWKFYSAVRMKLQRIKTEKASEYSALSNKSDDRVVGAKIRAKLDKCKVSPQQGNQEEFYIRWGEGIDDLRSLIEIGIAHNLIRKKGAWLYWVDPNGDEHSGQGMEKFRGMFSQDEKLHKILEKQVKPFMAVQASGKQQKNSEDSEELEEILSEIGSG